MLGGNYTNHSFESIILMILSFSDRNKYAETVFQCRIEGYVRLCEYVLHS
jgi:hypothetical protein